MHLIYSLRAIVYGLLIFAFCCKLGIGTAQDVGDESLMPPKERIEKLEEKKQRLESKDEHASSWTRYLELKNEQRLYYQNRDRKPDPYQYQDELNKLYYDSEVVMRQQAIFESERLIRKLRTPYYREAEAKGRVLCEDRQRQLMAKPVPPTPKLHELRLNVLSFPRIDGSTSTQPLASLIACRNFEVEHLWAGLSPMIREDWGLPTDVELQLAEYFLQAFPKQPSQKRMVGIINQLIVGNASTHQAYVNVIEQTSGLGLLARKPSEDEMVLAKSKGFELEVTPCALDAMVIIVNSDAPIVTLTQKQIKDIYAGNITNWLAIKPTWDAPITAYRRPKNSGSEELMQELIMKETQMAQVSDRLVGQLMRDVFLELGKHKTGIAYSVRYYEHFMSGSAETRAIAVDNIEPSFETIRDRSYPLLAEVFVVIRKDATPESTERQLYRWLLSPEGQAVVQQSGYVPIGETK